VCVGEAQGQEGKGIFMKLLGIFGVWLDWVCSSNEIWAGSLLLG
jgi:hypothetical protein